MTFPGTTFRVTIRGSARKTFIRQCIRGVYVESGTAQVDLISFMMDAARLGAELRC
jgi:hypothetical protein